ncbi:MAG: histone deacetylase, partial [Myxococcota bacterium]
MRYAPVLVVDDPRFEDHVSLKPHPESPERLSAARDGFFSGLGSMVYEKLELRCAPSHMRDNKMLSSVHEQGYLTELDSALARGEGTLDGDTFFSPGTREAAWSAAWGSYALGLRLQESESDLGVALVRPPGHHALPDRSMGFCLFNNAAMAVRGAQDGGAQKVAVVDWDVHHGNGTQTVFERDPNVLVLSIHQRELWPFTGAASEVGLGEGRG